MGNINKCIFEYVIYDPKSAYCQVLVCIFVNMPWGVPEPTICDSPSTSRHKGHSHFPLLDIAFWVLPDKFDCGVFRILLR